MLKFSQIQDGACHFQLGDLCYSSETMRFSVNCVKDNFSENIVTEIIKNILDIMESGLTEPEAPDPDTLTVISNLETKMEALEDIESEMPPGKNL